MDKDFPSFFTKFFDIHIRQWFFKVLHCLPLPQLWKIIICTRYIAKIWGEKMKKKLVHELNQLLNGIFPEYLNSNLGYLFKPFTALIIITLTLYCYLTNNTHSCWQYHSNLQCSLYQYGPQCPENEKIIK